MNSNNSLVRIFFKELIRQNQKREEIIASGYKSTSNYFALRSMIFSIMSAVGIFATILLFTYGFGSDNVALLVISLVFAIILGISGILTFIVSIITIVNQFKLNKRLYSFFGVIVNIILIVGSILFAFWII